MARRKPAPNMEQRDVDLSPAGFPEPGRNRVSFASRDPLLNVTAWLTGKPAEAMPRPRYQFHERPGDFSLTQYAGHDPFTQTIPIKFDGDGKRSVQGKIADLERLARRTAANDQPPVVKVAGAGVLHPELNWRISEIAEDTGRRLYLPNGDPHLFSAVVTLTQQIEDRLLAESMRAFKRRGQGPGIRNRTTRVRAGERSLYDVAKRVYHDPSAAQAIAVANPGTSMNRRLKVGQKLRLP